MYIDCESVYSSSLAVKQSSETLREKKLSGTFVLSVLTLFIVVIIVSKSITLSWRKNRFRSVDLTCWRSTNHCVSFRLATEFLKRVLVQGRQQSFWKFSILSNILDLLWCLPNKRKIHSQLSAMFTCRDGKGGELSSQASKMLYKPPGAVYIASYKEPLDQSDCWKLFVPLWNYTNTIYYINTCEIPGFLLLLKNHIFIARSERTIFVFRMWRYWYWCCHSY